MLGKISTDSGLGLREHAHSLGLRALGLGFGENVRSLGFRV